MIIIASPHSHSPIGATEREHDILSKNISMILHKQLILGRGVKRDEVMIFHADLPMKEHDLSLKTAKGISKMRDQLHSQLERQKGQFVFEIHSFPHIEGNSRLHNPLPEMIILEMDGDGGAAKGLFDYLEDQCVAVSLLKGSDENDILKTAIEHGNSGVMLDFREDLTEMERWALTKLISMWFSINVKK